jgi:hypothetical protein
MRRIAMLMRAKRMPALKALLGAKPAKPLHGQEKEKRRNEFKEMTANVDLKKLANTQREEHHEQ